MSVAEDDWPDVCVEYVQAIADTKLLLGHRYGERMASGQSIEDDVANMNLAQEEFGHVRQLSLLLESQGLDRTYLEHERDPEEYANASPLDEPVSDWAGFIVSQGLVDYAAWLLLDAITHEDVRGVKRKIAQEEYFHIERADGWVSHLVEDDPEALSTVLEDVVPGVLAFIGPASYDETTDPVYRTGFTDVPVATVRERFLDRYRELLADTEVTLDGLDNAQPPLDEWNDVRRRVNGGSMAQETAEIIRGERSRAFAVE